MGHQPTRWQSAAHFSNERVDSLPTLQTALMKPQGNPVRAADAIYELAHSNTYALLRLRWLTEPQQVTVLEEEAVQGPPVFPHLPRTTWPTQSQRFFAVPKALESPVVSLVDVQCVVVASPRPGHAQQHWAAPNLAWSEHARRGTGCIAWSGSDPYSSMGRGCGLGTCSI